MSVSASVADDPGEVSAYQTSDGCILRYRRWRSREPEAAILVALHGIQSHSGWYGFSSAALAMAGIDVRFLDRRGSGLNRELPRHAVDAGRLMDDVIEFIEQIEAKCDDGCRRSLILLGLSWGARLAAAVCGRMRDRIDGLVLLYPGIRTRIRPTRVQRGLLRLASVLGGGRIDIRVPLAAEQFTSSPRWQSFIRNDPLAVRQVPVSFLVAGEALGELSVQTLAELALPRLIVLAGQDEIVDLAGTRELLSRIPCESLRVIEYAQARHTLEFEPVRERFVAEVAEWIKSVREQQQDATLADGRSEGSRSLKGDGTQ